MTEEKTDRSGGDAPKRSSSKTKPREEHQTEFTISEGETQGDVAPNLDPKPARPKINIFGGFDPSSTNGTFGSGLSDGYLNYRDTKEKFYFLLLAVMQPKTLFKLYSPRGDNRYRFFLPDGPNGTIELDGKNKPERFLIAPVYDPKRDRVATIVIDTRDTAEYCVTPGLIEFERVAEQLDDKLFLAPLVIYFKPDPTLTIEKSDGRKVPVKHLVIARKVAPITRTPELLTSDDRQMKAANKFRERLQNWAPFRTFCNDLDGGVFKDLVESAAQEAGFDSGLGTDGSDEF